MKKKLLGTMLVVLLAVSMSGCQSEKVDEPSMENTMTEQGAEEKMPEAAQVLGITNDAELRCEISDKMGVEDILT